MGGSRLTFDLERLAERIEAQTDPEPFSGVVHVSEGDAVLFEQAYGFAIKPELIPNRADTRFPMASGCKAFTAVAICQLAERGVLGLDTRLADCLDVRFPNYSPDITIQHLLTHRSGITSYFEEDVDPDYEALWQSLPMYRVRELRDFLPLFQHKPMKFPPGERFEYNDGGFILLGLVIESVSGKGFPTYIREHVFAPAGMKDSGYFATDQLPKGTAHAYIRNPDGRWRANFFAVPIIGGSDGGAYITAPDMAAFWSALTEHRLLKPETTRLLLDDQVATPLKPPYTHYGHGVWVDRPDQAVRKYFVEGLDPGVAMRSAFYADRGILVTILGNTADAMWPLYDDVEKILAL